MDYRAQESAPCCKKLLAVPARGCQFLKGKHTWKEDATLSIDQSTWGLEVALVLGPFSDLAAARYGQKRVNQSSAVAGIVHQRV